MTDQILTEAEIADLRCLAGMIIPASAKYGVPGADDDTIFADIVNSIGRDAATSARRAGRIAHAGRWLVRRAGCRAPRRGGGEAARRGRRCLSACSPGSCCFAITAMIG